jgi:malonate transporter
VTGVLTGFAIIGSIIALGYVVQRSGLIGADARLPIARLIYFVLTPALLFTVMAEADLHVLISESMLVTVITIAIGAALYVAVSLIFFRRPAAETTIGTLAAVQANANNIGLPVSIYVLGSGQFVAPVLLFQTLILVPICLVILDLSTQAKVSISTILLQPFRNPAIVAALAGVAISVFGLEIPPAVFEPFALVGAAAIPLFLMTFGMALHGQKPFAKGSGRREVAVASAIKVVVMPVAAYLFGHFVFGLNDQQLFTVVVLAALPTAQNVYNFAQRFGRGESVALGAVTVSTVLAVPVLLIGAALLNP